jgi:putative transposase
MMYVRFPLSLRNVEDLLFERGIDISHETVRLGSRHAPGMAALPRWWNRFGPMFAADIRRQRVSRMRGFKHWNWHLDEMYVKIGGEMHYLWRAVDHEGEILESYVTKTRDKKAALAFIKKALKRHGRVETFTTDGLSSYAAAMDELGNRAKQEIGRWANNRVENSHLPFRRRQRRTAKPGAWRAPSRAMLRFRQMTRRAAEPARSKCSPQTAISLIDRLTSSTARLPWPSGSFSLPDPPLLPALALPNRDKLRLV